MTDIALLDRAFYHIMQRFIKTGQAPHHTELAKDLGMGMEEGRQLFHDLMAAGVPGWLHPQTDWIASFPPFNNQPTQYRMTIDGEQKWFAQWGFEALAVRWLFPGKKVRLEANCLDCGEPMVVEMKDEVFLSIQPQAIVGYTYGEVGGTIETRPYRWAGMNLFRSEEHARNWASFNPEFVKTLKPLSFWADLFNNPIFRSGGRLDYISWLGTDETKQARKLLATKMP